MLYHLFKYFDNVHNLPGAGMFQYISFRAAAAIIIALLIVIVFGRNIINFLRRKQIGEEIRDLGLEGQLQKKGTPTMGGALILVAIGISTLLCRISMCPKSSSAFFTISPQAWKSATEA